MRLIEWESTIQQITAEYNREPTESRKTKVLIEWRGRLKKDPANLPTEQIDKIMREVRRRLNDLKL